MELDVYVLIGLIKLLPNPVTFAKDKYVIVVNDTDSFTYVTFLKKNNKWKLLINSDVEKTQKLHARECNTAWVDEMSEITEDQLNLLKHRVCPVN